MSRPGRAALLQLLLAVPLAAGAFLALRFLPVAEWLDGAQREMDQMGPGAAALFPLVYALCNIFLLPAGILSIGGGFLFGLWWGWALVLLGNVLGAAAAFWIGRFIGRAWLEKHLLVRPKWAALDAALVREGWKMVLLSQIHPLFPTSLLNYLYGITRVRFLPCMGWVALGQAPGIFLYAYLGTLGQLGVNLWRGHSHPRPVEYVVWIGGLLLAASVTTCLARIALRLLREAGEEAMNPEEASSPSKPALPVAPDPGSPLA